MLIKQLSVFVENMKGRLVGITEVLLKEGINIASFSLADSSEYGILRMIVSDPEKAREVLKEQGLSARLTEVIAVKIKQEPGTLSNLLKMFSEEGFSVEYMYTLSTAGNNTSIIMKLADPKAGLEALSKHGYELCTDVEAYEINNYRSNL